MSQRKRAERRETSVVYRVFISAVTIIALVIAAAYYLLPGPQVVRQVLYIVDSLIAFILLGDFFYSLYHARDRFGYFVTFGWLDLLGSIPGFPFLRAARIPGLVRTYRVLRRETPTEVLSDARSQLASSTLMSAIVIVMLVITVGSIAIVLVEEGAANSNIRTGEDAVWWAIVTMATVGYGDRYPTTAEGRLIGAAVIFVGVGLFSVLTSFIATNFVARRESVERTTDDAALRATLTEILNEQRAAFERESSGLREELAEVRRLLEAVQPAGARPPMPREDGQAAPGTGIPQ